MASSQEEKVQEAEASEPDGVIGLLSPSAKPEDLMLLKKLEEANRLLEQDRKSMQTLNVSTNTSKHSSQSGHSRQGSVSSVLSNNSISSNISNLQYEEEAAETWRSLISDLWNALVFNNNGIPSIDTNIDGNNPDDAWVVWGKVVNDWEIIWKKKASAIRELIRKGVPHHFRGIVWQLVCDACTSPDKQLYAEYLKKTSPFEKVIRRDIARTYPEHDFFKEKNGLGQESLFNVIKAYSLHDREVGYCQGSGFIVGLLLMQMPEEEAFAVFVKLMQEYRLRDMFKPSMAELGLCMFQLECMVQEQLPELYMHFQSQSFCVSMFASSWFLTLFTTVLTLPVACRIFDVFLSEGLEIIFRVAFAILEIGYDELMAQDMEGMLRFFQRDMPAKHDQDPDFLLNTAYQVKYSARKMKKLEKEYNALKSKEQEEQVELRRLRTENRLLRQRIDNLEKETATLADRLVQDQVVRAQKEEEMFGLKRELAQVKQHDAATSHKLVEANEAIQEFKRSDSAMSTSSCGSHQEETIHQLEEELMQVRLREAESCSLIRELRDKIRELESMNRQLQKEPCQEIQVLQEELIASKLREAEATLSMKELRQKVSDLDKCWQKHLERTNAATAKPPSKTREQSLNEEVMTVRMREAEAMAELKEMKQKVMELETQNQICNRQIKRMDDENQRVKAKLEDGAEREKETKYHMTEMERKVTDLESKRKEDSMMCRIKDAEHTQTIAEMRQRIAELEIENQELVTAGQLSEKGECQELENKIADLQEEVMQLKMARKLQSLSSLALNHIALDTESDYDTDDLDATMAEANRSRLQGLEGLDKPMSHSAIRQSLQDLDSSEGEGLYNHDGGTVKRRTSKKKRRNLSKGDATKDTNGSRGESAKRDSVDEGASGEESESNTNGVCQSNGATENAQTQLLGAASPGEKDTVQVNGALYTDDTSTTSSSM